jgi:LmbE family N-acetylglucosaminyl deacetylase
VRIIYFSPHLDDAVLSAGGLIRRQVGEGAEVEIWTFMAGVPEVAELSDFAKEMHGLWGFESAEQTVYARRAEDQRAASVVGAKAVHFDFLDCIYRRGRNRQVLYSDVFVPIHADDADLAAQIGQTMIAWLRPDDQVVCQLSIGAHVDHVIVRKAAELLRRPLIYDADMPYLLNHPDELKPNVMGMQESLQPVSEAGLECWIAGIECYASQIGAVFGGHKEMQEGMRGYWKEQRGVRYWTRVDIHHR